MAAKRTANKTSGKPTKMKLKKGDVPPQFVVVSWDGAAELVDNPLLSRFRKVSRETGAHMTLFAKVIELLKDREAEDIRVFGGGIIPEDDIPQLKALGVAAIFTPGTPTGTVVTWVRDNLQRAA